MEINGLPLHPLVVHAAVIFVPLAALAALAYALVPKWRWALRHPSLALAVVAAASTQVASLSGESLRDDRGLFTPAVETHELWAGRMLYSVWVLAGLVAVAWWALPHVTALAGRKDREARVGALVIPLTVLLPLAALVTLFLAYKTGDAGAKAVWG
ncbi:conserved membrane hypothetical protein [metagenome]|uniref:DUF2231 domain-containing protein n=1 Tax=metagenome TaxID=256318 RepID=A0A2P2C532_9ZZZZ